MLSEVKKILFTQIKEEVEEYETIQKRLAEIERQLNIIPRIDDSKTDIPSFWSPPTPDSDDFEKAGFGEEPHSLVLSEPEKPKFDTRKFSFLQRWIFNRRQYLLIEQLNKEKQAKYDLEMENYLKLKSHYEDQRTKLEEEKGELKSRLPSLQEAKDFFDKTKEARTLKDLGLSFEDAVSLLEQGGLPLILTEEDKIIAENESDFDKEEDFVLVHKTHFIPTNDEVKSQRASKATASASMVMDNGEKFDFDYEKGRNTVHFSQNGEVSSHEGGIFEGRKYAVILPFKDLEERR